MRMMILVCAILAVVSGVGCKRTKTGASEHFSKQYSCPSDRVSARARDDLKGSQVSAPQNETGTAPAEVRSDPARLAVWQRSEREKTDEPRKILDGLDVFEVRGCGHAEYLLCWSYNDEQNGESGVSCSEGSTLKPAP